MWHFKRHYLSFSPPISGFLRNSFAAMIADPGPLSVTPNDVVQMRRTSIVSLAQRDRRLGFVPSGLFPEPQLDLPNGWPDDMPFPDDRYPAHGLTEECAKALLGGQHRLRVYMHGTCKRVFVVKVPENHPEGQEADFESIEELLMVQCRQVYFTRLLTLVAHRHMCITPGLVCTGASGPWRAPDYE